VRSHKDLLKGISDFLVKYLPEETKAVLEYTKQKSRDLLIKLIPALRAFGFVDSIDKNYSVYWLIDLANISLVKEVLIARLKDLCS
jgi:hypothetical protein